MIGAQLAHYRIVGKLGKGAMGEVYLAEDTKLERQIALKVLPTELGTDPERLERFEREAKALAALDHPNIVTVFSVESSGPVHFLTMQLVKGSPLNQLIPDGGMPLERIVGIGTQLAEAIAAAHREGIVHRDLKPANVMVSDEGRVRVLDFGLAKSHRVPDAAAATQLATEALTQEGVVMGTIPYMSPEQVQGGEADARSDLFSLGIVLYEMATGVRPFSGGTALEQMWSIVKDTPQPLDELRPGVPENLRELIYECLEKQPDRRPASALVVRDRMDGVEVDPSGETKTFTGASPVSPEPGSRERIWWFVAALVLVLTAIGVGSRMFLQSPSSTDTDIQEPAVESQLVANRILVVPFENRTGDPALDPVGMMAADWITQGLTQAGIGEVVSSLAALSSLRGVTEATEGPPQPQDLAIDSGAGILISGSYYSQGDELLFSAEALDAAAGEIITAVEPIHTAQDNALGAVESLRQRIMVIVASHLDERLQSYAETLQIPSYEGYREYTQGMERYVRMDFPAAIGHFQRATGEDPQWPAPLLSSAMAHINLGRFAEAHSLARRAELERPLQSPLDEHFLDRILATCDENPLEALRAARLGAELAPEGPFAFDAGALAIRTNYAQEAVDRLESLDPDRGFLRGFAPYWFYLTEALHVLGDHERELAAAQRARLAQPEQLDVLSFEVRALAALNSLARLQPLLDEAETLRAGRTTPGTIMLETASELEAHGSPKESRELAQRAVTWYRDRSEDEMKRTSYRASLARSLLLTGELDEAQEVFAVLADKEPDSVASRGRLGVAAARRGDEETTQATLAWLASTDQPYLFGAELYWQAAIHAWHGDLEQAVRLYREALAAGLPFGWPEVHPHADPMLQPLWGNPDFQRLIKPR